MDDIKKDVKNNTDEINIKIKNEINEIKKE